MNRLLLAAVLIVAPARSESVEKTLIDFEIADQFDEVHRRDDFAERIVVILGSDKDGSEFNPLWGAAIADSLAGEPGFERVSFLPVADLRGVPFFLKGWVRGKFPKERHKWTLTDWKGEFAKAYEFREKSSNLVVFDRHGNLAVRAFGREPHPRTLEAVVRTIRALIGPLAASPVEPDTSAAIFH